MAETGHNSEAADDRLRLLVERIENMNAEKKAIADDIKDIFLEAKAVGYDPKIMREVIKLRAMNPDDRKERDALIDVYRIALGLQYV